MKSLRKVYSMTVKDCLNSPEDEKSEVKKVKKLEISEKREKKFKKIFEKKIPDDEKLLNYFSCAFSAEILLQGHLYVSENYFSFHSSILGYVTKFVIPTTSVTKITKEKTARMIPNAIGVELMDGTRLLFGSFMSRKRAFELMMEIIERKQRLMVVEYLKYELNIKMSENEVESDEEVEKYEEEVTTDSETDEPPFEAFYEPIQQQIEIKKPQSTLTSAIFFIGIVLIVFLGLFSTSEQYSKLIFVILAYALVVRLTNKN